MLYQVLKNLIDNNIRNKVPKVLKVEHANVEQALLDEVYPVPVDDTSTLKVYTNTSTASSYAYFVKFTKIGRRVNIDGWIINISSLQASNVDVFTFRDTVASLANPFLPDDTTDPNSSLPYTYRGEAIRTQDNSRVRILVVKDSGIYKFRISGLFPTNGTSNNNNDRYQFNFSYNCKN